MWEKYSIYILGVVIFVSGIYQTFFGEAAIGILTLICFALITAPGFFTKGYIKKFPFEIVLLLFFMILLQFVLGEARDFYTTVPYYDKIVHYMIPLFIGIIGFLLFYTMHETGKLKTSVTVMMLIIIFMTMGIGASWEIVEYLSDEFVEPHIEGWHHFQGNAEQDALDDTMTDLIDDTLGAIFGAFLGLWYMQKVAKGKRGKQLIAEIDTTFKKGSEKKT